jgi:hypothetical protein
VDGVTKRSAARQVVDILGKFLYHQWRKQYRANLMELTEQRKVRISGVWRPSTILSSAWYNQDEGAS